MKTLGEEEKMETDKFLSYIKTLIEDSNHYSISEHQPIQQIPSDSIYGKCEALPVRIITIIATMTPKVLKDAKHT